MDEWKTYKFSEVAEFISDKINLSEIEKNQYISTENMLCNLQGIEEASCLSTGNRCNSFVKGDILFSNIRTYFKKVWLAEFNGGCSADVLVIRSKDENILLTSFLYLIICSQEFIDFTVSTAIGAKMPRGDKAAILNYEFKVPPIEVQNEYVDYYLSFNKKIQLNNQTNQTLEAIAQAIFKSWFIDFDPVKAKAQAIQDGKTAREANLAAMTVISGKVIEELNETEFKQLWEIAEAFPSEMVESEEFGEVPKGWKVKKVDDIVERLKNKQKLQKEDITDIGNIPVFEQGTNILMGYHLQDAGFNASLDNPIFIFGDHTCITHLSTKPFSIYQNVIPLKGKNLPTYWVYCAIQGKQVFLEYRRHWMEFIVKDVILPDNKFLCEIFSEKIQYVFEIKDCLREENRNLEKIRDLLLPKLLNGKF